MSDCPKLVLRAGGHALRLQPATQQVRLLAKAHQVSMSPCSVQVRLPAAKAQVRLQPGHPEVHLSQPRSTLRLAASPVVVQGGPAPQPSAADSTYEAAVDPAWAVGTCLIFTWSTLQGLPVMALADPTAFTHMPCVGLLDSIVQPGQARVRTQGLLQGLSGLVPGAQYFVGAQGHPVLPSALEGLSAAHYLQPIGVAQSATSLWVERWPIIAKRTLP